MPATETLEQVRGSRWWGIWAGQAVLTLFLVILIIGTSIFNAEQRKLADCHSALMNDLHSGLGQALIDHPDDLAWVEIWEQDFKDWEERMNAQCAPLDVEHSH